MSLYTLHQERPTVVHGPAERAHQPPCRLAGPGANSCRAHGLAKSAHHQPSCCLAPSAFLLPCTISRPAAWQDPEWVEEQLALLRDMLPELLGKLERLKASLVLQLVSDTAVRLPARCLHGLGARCSASGPPGSLVRAAVEAAPCRPALNCGAMCGSSVLCAPLGGARTWSGQPARHDA